MWRNYPLDVNEDDGKTHSLQTWQCFYFSYEREVFLIFYLCGLRTDLATALEQLFERHSGERSVTYLSLPFHSIALMPVKYLFNQRR